MRGKNEILFRQLAKFRNSCPFLKKTPIEKLREMANSQVEGCCNANCSEDCSLSHFSLRCPIISEALKVSEQKSVDNKKEAFVKLKTII
jgi:hypothetical protein